LIRARRSPEVETIGLSDEVSAETKKMTKVDRTLHVILNDVKDLSRRAAPPK
jgi:hypothetical protein